MSKLDGRSTRYVKEHGGTLSMLRDHEKRIERLEKKFKRKVQERKFQGMLMEAKE